MKSTTQIVKAIGITLLASCATSRAEDWADKFYVHTDIGPAFISSRPTTSFGFDPGAGFIHKKGHFRADDGLRGDLALGYNLTKSFALETEAGVIWNSGPSIHDSFYQIPVMLNAVYQIQFSDSWKAYVGAGAGGVISMTHSEVLDYRFFTPFKYDDSDWSPGYQLEAGIKYALSSHAEVDLGYKFLDVAQYTYSFRGIIREEQVSNLVTHSPQLSFTWKF